MEPEIAYPAELCDHEAVRFIARRYGTTPESVVMQFMVQENLITPNEIKEYELAPNEIALLHDLAMTYTVIK